MQLMRVEDLNLSYLLENRIILLNHKSFDNLIYNFFFLVEENGDPTLLPFDFVFVFFFFYY